MRNKSKLGKVEEGKIYIDDDFFQENRRVQKMITFKANEVRKKRKLSK